MPFFINDVFNSEGNTGTTAFTFTVTRTNPIGSASVNYTTAPATTNPATSGVDFVATSGTLNFLDGETSKTITVLVNGDTTLEPDEFFNVILSNPIGDTIGDSVGMGVIRNDDAAPPTVSITPTPGISLPEGNSGTTAYTFTVALSTSTTQPVTVNYSTNDGTATLLDNDYQDNDGTLTFLPGGPLTQTITVLANGDTQLESTETFTVSLNSTTNAVINSSASVAVGTIVNDELVYTLTASDSLTVLEGDSSSTLRTFVINRVGVTTQASTLNFDLAGSATLGTDYTLVGITGSGISVSGNTIQFAAGATSAVITLAIQGDTQIENDETILLTIADPASLATIVGSPISTTIVNDDVFVPTLPIVSISASDGSAAEAGSDPGTFTISRTGDTTTALTVNYTIGGTATNGVDYTPALTGTVTIPVGQSSVDIPIPPVDDLADEPDESVILTLTDSTTYDLGTASATVTITDNDIVLPPPSSIVSITASDPDAAEAGSDAGTFTISRSGDTSETLTVNYTIGGTATSGTDYLSLVQTATIPAGQTSVEVTVSPIDDSEIEGNETVSITLIDSANYDLDVATATVTIADNDFLPPPLPTVSITATDPTASEAGTDPGAFTITRTGDTSEALTVSYTVSGSATNSTDYTAITETVTIPAGQSSVNVIITPTDDLEVEGDETVNLTLTSNAAYDLGTATASVTIADNDVLPPPLPTVSITATDSTAAEAGTDPGAFTITRTGDTSEALTVSYTVGGSATNSTDYTAITETVTIPAGQSSVNVIITPTDDLDVEGDETVNLTLTSNAAYDLGTATASVTIADNDVLPPPLPTVSITATDSTAAEAGTDPGAFTITRTGDTSEALTVSYTVGGSATNGADYTAITETVTIPAGQSSVNVIITPTDDLDVEGDETVNLTLTSNAAYDLETSVATITIVDNDLLPLLPTISIDNVSLSEGNSDITVFTFTVSLSTASSSVVTVDYATIDGSATAISDYTAIPLTTLTFAPGQTSQTITVNIQGDLDVEVDETLFVNLSNPTGATIAVSQGLGTILNDDVPVVVNTPPNALDDQARVTEGQAVTISVLANDSDPDGNPLTIDSFTNPQFGTLVRHPDGTFTYQANLDFAGTDSFTYQISDGQGGIGQATVTITIDPLNLIGTDCCDRLIGTNSGNRIEGRGGNDWIDGRGGNDWLNGEAGWDTLIGGLGADRFVFASGSAFNPCSLGVDTIVDFDRMQGDAIVLSRTTFTALSSLVGDALTADDFAVVNSACDGASLAAASVARIVFNQATGDLFYNQNGSCCGFGSGGRFATLSVNSSTTPLQASDFRVIA